MSLQVREVPTTDCCRCQSVQIEVKNYNQLEAKSLHSSNTQICCEDLFFSVFSATQLIIFLFCMCLLHISWTNFALKRETQFQSQCLPNMLQLRHLDSFIIAQITPDNIKL